MYSSLLLFLALLLSTAAPLSAKIRLLTFHCNKPEFIELQYRTLERFMENEYELIVINDAKTWQLDRAITEVCNRYNIQCVRYEQEWHELDPLNLQIFEWLCTSGVHSYHWFGEYSLSSIANQPSVRHSHLIGFALENFGYDHDDIVALIDGDVFPIRPLNVRELLENQDIIAVRKRFPEDPEDPLTNDRIDYLWVTFVAFNPRTLPDVRSLKFHVDLIHSKIHDTGAATFRYLQTHPDLRISLFPRYSSEILSKLTIDNLSEIGCSKDEIDFIKILPARHVVEFYLNNKLLHFAASSWDHEGHLEKTEHIQFYIEYLLSKKSA